MSSVIVDLKNLTREFRMGDETVKALNDVSFTINSGEFITIMGSSGSGKTTLLNILGCLDKPTGGDYLLDGTNVSTLSKNELARLRNKKLGFIFQSYNLLARTSAIENVELPLLYNPEISAKQRREKAMSALEAVNLTDRIHYLPSQLSGGQQQRVAIARALVNDPVMILADEATGNLDSRTSYGIMVLMQELNEVHGKTIVFITHEPDIATFSKRTITLRDGMIIKDSVNTNVRNAKEVLESLPPIPDLITVAK
ncbi:MULTISPECIES: ABC transporter ATP-binding protein [unclassified Flavobacterium]|jgi:putative ABC transport system ATP-binding protein|uniref:ABC transporter ATP-binding protein n=1 Tax=unclassified Flavobacterium TaxID=196869 RepID=UPI0025BC0ED3|nr:MULTISPECIES: ABC transporter ATP-binding protein [unclassified Flavobacterium]